MKRLTLIDVEVNYKGDVYRVKDKDVHLFVKDNKVKLIIGYLQTVRTDIEIYVKCKFDNTILRNKIEHLVIDNKDFEEYDKQENI